MAAGASRERTCAGSRQGGRDVSADYESPANRSETRRVVRTARNLCGFTFF